MDFGKRIRGAIHWFRKRTGLTSSKKRVVEAEPHSEVSQTLQSSGENMEQDLDARPASGSVSESISCDLVHYNYKSCGTPLKKTFKATFAQTKSLEKNVNHEMNVNKPVVVYQNPSTLPASQPVQHLVVPNTSAQLTPPDASHFDQERTRHNPDEVEGFPSSRTWSQGTDIRITDHSTDASNQFINLEVEGDHELNNDSANYRLNTFGFPERGRHKKVNKNKNIQVQYTKVFGESDGAYKNDSKPRGMTFICNFAKFDTHAPRFGSEKDCKNLRSLFQQMGYCNYGHPDKYIMEGYIRKDDFINKLKEFCQDRRQTMMGSCVIIIMSHGSGSKTFLTSDSQEVNLMEVYTILDNINCTILSGKPKIFIFQFCRNSDLRERFPSSPPPAIGSVELATLREEIQTLVNNLEDNMKRLIAKTYNQQSFENNKHFIENQSLKLASNVFPPEVIDNTQENLDSPFEDQIYSYDAITIPSLPQEGLQRYSDMYSVFSTASGELSHRDPKKGSLLIQAICHVFAENAYHDDLEKLIMKVSTYMKKTLQKNDPITVPRQTCERTNNGLDKLFYFNPVYLPLKRHETI